MEPHIDPLSPNDHKLLEKLRGSRVPFWRKPIGWVLISFGCLVLALCLLSVLLQIDGTPFLFIGVIGLLAGLVELREFRYRTIVRHLLIERDHNGATASNVLTP